MKAWWPAILLCLPLGAQHIPAASQKNPFADNANAIAAGQRAYEWSCQVCHGGDGRGGRGPALATGKFAHGDSDGEIFASIRDGIPGTQMPPFNNLSNEEIWELVAYIRSLAGSVAEEPLKGDPAAGEKMFAGKGGCQACHEVNGRGGRMGPELSAIGSWTAQALREVILKPNEREGRKPNVIVARTRDGREIRGVQRNEDTFSVQLMDAADQIHALEKSHLAEVRLETRSIMPDDYGKRLTASEIENLVAYLKTLRKRDLTQTASAPISGGLAYERIANAEKEPHNWLTYWGDYRARHYTPLNQIHTANAGRLQAKWALQVPGEGVLQATPLVVDGIMYTTGPLGQVFCIDARSGRVIWKYQWKMKKKNPYDGLKVNRGVAMLGNRLFLTTLDAHVVALDARTGQPLWNVEMADTMQGYGATMAPLALKDKIIAGISGAEMGTRGFLDAYDPATGKRIWRFYTIPGPGEFGHETWSGDSWKRGGASTWLTGSYDPDTDTLYWGCGNTGPDLNGEVRKGDNLFASSLVVLDAKTGKRKWHFQFTPHDTHDWDSTEAYILVDRMFRGQQRKLVLHADRNAFFYVLDRETGKFLLGKPFARQTWAKGLDDHGRPILTPNSESSPEGPLHYPSLWGATNWMAPSYDPNTGWVYIAFREAGDRYFQAPAVYEPGKAYWGGKVVSPDEPEWGGVKAINPETGNIEWEYKFHLGTLSAGVLATGGGVLFSASREGNLMAFDSRSGKLLWRFNTGAQIDSSPMSYAVDGKQYVAISAGQVLYSFALPD